MPELDVKLVASLKQAKTSPMFFALVAKGNEGKLLVEKRKISPKDAAEAKKTCGGGTLFQGRCHGEEGVMIFEVGKQAPPTLAALTKKIIKQSAGLTFEVEYRVAADLAPEEGAGEGAEEAGGTTDVPAAPPLQGGAEVMKRLNAMGPNIKTALAGANKTRVQALFVSVSGLIKNKDFAQADAQLDELERLLTQEQGGAEAEGQENTASVAIWQKAKDAADQQLAQLADMMRAAEVDELGVVAEQMEKVLGGFRVALIAALMDYDGAAGAAKETARAKALAVVKQYQTAIPTDKYIQGADTNPFDVSVTIAQTLGAALGELSAVLAPR